MSMVKLREGERGIREEIDKGKGKEGIEGREGERGEGETWGAPICDLSNHQLKSTLMAPEPDAQQRCTFGFSPTPSTNAKFIGLSPGMGVEVWRVATLSSNAGSLQHLMGSGNDAITDRRLSKVCH